MQKGMVRLFVGSPKQNVLVKIHMIV